MKIKKNILPIILLFVFLIAATDLNASTTIYLDSVNTGPNQTAVFSLYVSNDQPFVGFQLDVVYPNVLTYISGSAQLTSRALDHSIFASIVSPGVLRIIVYSVTLSSFNGTSGAVFTLNFTSGTTSGTYPIEIQNAIVADSSQHNILTDFHNGIFILNAPKLNITPQTINFGSVPLYQNSTRSIVLTNAGNIDLHISKFSINQNVFRMNDSSSITIPAGGSITKVVNFSSSIKGNYTGELTIFSDDPSNLTQKVILSGVAFAVNELRIGNVNGRSGHIFHLPVSINNMEQFTGFEFKIQLPSVAKFIKGSETLSGRGIDHIVVADTSGNTLTVLAYSPTNSAFNDSDGIVLTLDFLVQGQGGYYAISPSNVVISNSFAENIISAFYSGSIQVISPNMYLNTYTIDYGNVSAKDTAIALLVISNYGSDTLQINSFVINNSSFSASFVIPAKIAPGESRNINILFHSIQEGTHNSQITIRSNDFQNDPVNVILSANVYLPNILSIVDGMGFKGESGLITINLDNMKAITGIQCDVQLPTAITIKLDSIRLTQRKKDHIITASILPSGFLRIITYSPSLASFSSDSGAIMELPVILSDTVGTFQIHLSNAILSDTTGKNVLTGTNDGYYKIFPREITVTSNISPLWNIISVPIIPNDYAVITLFPDAISKAFGFDKKYVYTDTLQKGYGYWLKFGSSSVLNITGLPIISDTFSVQTGWNLIGSISAGVNVDSIFVSPPDNISSFYFGFKGGYRVTDSILPGQGYWVKVFNPGSLILQTDINNIYSLTKKNIFIENYSTSTNPSYSAIPYKVIDSFLDTLNFLDISDADSYSQKLFFGSADIDSLTLLKYELPPKPPDDAFDARFISGRFLETLPEDFDSTDFTVEIQTNSYPITIVWDIKQTGIDYYIIENRNNVEIKTDMKKDSVLVISDTTENKFILRCIPKYVSVDEWKNEIPTKINLEQNYPNPFNPSTTIIFDLPNAQLIDLSVYDITGKKVRTLANGKYLSGSYKINFNASNLSSGIYILKLTTEDRILTKKIALIK